VSLHNNIAHQSDVLPMLA